MMVNRKFVRKYLHTKGVRTSKDIYTALDSHMEGILDRAAERTLAHGKKTAGSMDI